MCQSRASYYQNLKGSAVLNNCEWNSIAITFGDTMEILPKLANSSACSILKFASIYSRVIPDSDYIDTIKDFIRQTLPE